MLLSQFPSHCSYILLKSYFPLGNKNEIRMHLELGLEMIKQYALAQHLCCIFTRKCFLRLDTQVLAGLCARSLACVGHVPGLLSVRKGSGGTGHFTFCCGELVLGQEFWLFPARLVIYLNLPCYTLEKGGNELNGDFVLLSSENTGAMEFITSYWNTGQPGVEVMGGSI